MLPVESLADAVSFLPLYDLDSVLLANRRLSTIASKCVKHIGSWELPYVSLVVRRNLMALMDEEIIYVEGRENMTDVLDIALHNSRFAYLSLTVSPDEALPLPNKSALEIEKLDLHGEGAASAGHLVDVIARFRKVHVVRLFKCGNVADFSPVVELCRRKGIKSVVDCIHGVDLMAEQ